MNHLGKSESILESAVKSESEEEFDTMKSESEIELKTKSESEVPLIKRHVEDGTTLKQTQRENGRVIRTKTGKCQSYPFV